MHKTSASPLAWIYAGLVVYASLYPFADWRDQGVVLWDFLTSPLPRYWTSFDVSINILGYMPFGFLLALSGLRTEHSRHPLGLAALLAGVLSLAMESLQNYLPTRVPSNVDLVLNVVGAVLGALLAWAMERLGIIDRWSSFRARWFVADARGGLVLLTLWPVALLFPVAVPFGLGQVLERLEALLGSVFEGSLLLNWLPVRDIELQPLVPGAELLCVMLGILIPCLLGFCIICSIRQRALFALVVFVFGIVTTALSAALSYGPEHAWAWFDAPVRAGLVLAFVLAMFMLPLSRRVSVVVVLLGLSTQLSLLNQAPTSPYFAQTLATWEQGRFIRFHGLVQWIGWLWPYAALVYILLQIGRHQPKN